MGSIIQTSKMFMPSFCKRLKFLTNVSWSVRVNIRARLCCTSAGVWPVNVKRQNNDIGLKSLHEHSPMSRNQRLHSCHGLFAGNNNCLHPYSRGGVSSFLLFDRQFSTTSFIRSNVPNNTDKQPTPASTAEKIGPNLKDLKENVMTVPNLLTMSRMVLSPAVGYLVLMESYATACGIFVFVGITDVLDGWIARTFPSQASAAGSFLDPLADKLLVTVLFLSLTMVNLIPWPLTGLVLARDFLLIAAAFYIRYITLPPPRSLSKYFNVTTATAQLKPTFLSKFNTAVQLFLVAFSLGAPVFGYVDHIALQCLWYLTAGTTFASGLTYVFAKNTFETLRKTKGTPSS